MKKHSLLKTNILVCTIILIGFFITAVVSYKSNIGVFEKDVEHVSTLATEGINSQIESIFSRPVSVSLTMANDQLLKTFLTEENKNPGNKAYIARMQAYLDAYRKKYNYDSVFLVSTKTRHYYHYSGLNRTLFEGNPENVWYYNFLKNDEEYALNIDNDEATDDSITVFVNCKIRDANGFIMGVVGVGFKVDSLQKLLKSYDEQFHVEATLINDKGFIEVSSAKNGHESVNFFGDNSLANFRDRILEISEKLQTFWYSSDNRDGYVVIQYIPELKWHLVVENDVSTIRSKFREQIAWGFFIILGVIGLVMFAITSLIKKYNAQIVKLTVSQETEYHRLLHSATEELYENIYEMDISRNRAGGETTRHYFESLGIGADGSYDQALDAFSRQIKEEYVAGYLDTFHSTHVLAAYEKGIHNLSYDFLCSEDRTHYHWMRINAQIFFWHSDQSVRMITYRKNIDAEKKREQGLLEETLKDSMTGLYNKRATEQLIAQDLENSHGTDKKHAYLIVDIDHFKTINDQYGHAFGDEVISEFTAELKSQFRNDDIVGRIGGDEFAILMKNVGQTDTVREKLDRICARFNIKEFGQNQTFHLSTSIGVALFPEQGTSYKELNEKADQALYFSKTSGRGRFTIFGEEVSFSDLSHINQRDIETLLHNATDGIAKLACIDNLSLLYSNEKFARLTGTPDKLVSSLHVSGWSLIHPDDKEKVRQAIISAMTDKVPFTVFVRLRHYFDGHIISVRLNGRFASELYENRYPVFYALITDLANVTESDSR